MHAVAARVSGAVERLVGAVDQAGDGFTGPQFGNADGHGDLVQAFKGPADDGFADPLGAAQGTVMNSSLPTRPMALLRPLLLTLSMVRSAPRTRRAKAARMRSPVTWPKRSFMSLK